MSSIHPRLQYQKNKKVTNYKRVGEKEIAEEGNPQLTKMTRNQGIKEGNHCVNRRSSRDRERESAREDRSPERERERRA